MSSDLKLYWTLGSQPARAIKSLLEAGNVPHEAIHLNLFEAEHKSEKILKLNPSGMIPFIVFNDQPSYESAAILRYLAQKYLSLNQFYPNNLE